MIDTYLHYEDEDNKQYADMYRFIRTHPRLWIFECIWTPEELDEAIIKAMKEE